MLHKIVVHARPAWRIAWNGRFFDRFGSRDEAVMVALQWAENARAQGHRVKVMLEDLGGALQPVMGAVMSRRVRQPSARNRGQAASVASALGPG